MAYSLEQLAADCRAALREDPGPDGREVVRGLVARACQDEEFVRAHLGPEAEAERNVLYQDPDMGFCILAHVYKGPKTSEPHDHGPSWAIYGQALGTTEMTDWRKLSPPSAGQPGKVEAVRTYRMEPGDAYLYNEGDLHSPHRTAETRLIRIEGTDMKKVTRDRYEAA
jgi:hypothetical protein